MQMSRIKRIIVSIAATLGMLAPIAAPVAVSAQTDIDGNLACGAELDFSTNPDGTADCKTENANAGTRVNDIVTAVINILSLVVGVVAVIMIIVGGLRYITSNGDSGQVGNAKNTILYAVVGLIVVALAQVIVRFVVNRATADGTDTTADDDLTS
jgi:uncharacterized membrane protein